MLDLLQNPNKLQTSLLTVPLCLSVGSATLVTYHPGNEKLTNGLRFEMINGIKNNKNVVSGQWSRLRRTGLSGRDFPRVRCWTRESGRLGVETAESWSSKTWFFSHRGDADNVCSNFTDIRVCPFPSRHSEQNLHICASSHIYLNFCFCLIRKVT